MTLAIKDNSKPIVIDPGRTMHTKLPHSDLFTFRKDPSAQDCLRNVFLILSSSALNSNSELLAQTLKKLPKLRIVFVIMDTDFDVFFDHVSELKIQTLLSKIFLVERISQIDRVLESWTAGQQSRRFAAARVQGSKFIAKACDLAKYEIDLLSLPAFSSIAIGKFQNPVIDQKGTKVSWPDLELDLDFDTVRYCAEPSYKLELDLAAVHSYPHYGAAVREARESLGLTQELVSLKTQLSTRHLSRIENSEQPLTKKLTVKLAQSHQLSLDQYILQLLNTCIQIDNIKTRRRKSPLTN